MKARLIFTDNSSPPIEIAGDVLVVGRREDCDIRLEHKSISKLHCVIARAHGTIHVRDLGSTNGTHVNGQRVRRAALAPNDQLNIANLIFRVWMGPDDVPSVAARKLDVFAGDRSIDSSAQPENDSDAAMIVGPPVQANDLPDVYPQ